MEPRSRPGGHNLCTCSQALPGNERGSDCCTIGFQESGIIL